MSATVAYADAGTGTATAGTDYTAVPAGHADLRAGGNVEDRHRRGEGRRRVRRCNETVVIATEQPIECNHRRRQGGGHGYDHRRRHPAARGDRLAGALRAHRGGRHPGCNRPADERWAGR